MQKPIEMDKSQYSPPNYNFKDMKDRPLDADKTIYLTGQQASVLQNKSKFCLKALLFGDFGSGIIYDIYE